jgi:threonine aldolase
VALENTHNFHGGAVLPLENIRAIREITAASGVALHMDGARIWNAAAKTGTPLSVYGKLCDTLSVCLSKGLGAPVGSVALGPAEFVVRARRLRKRLGGGMRQSGVLAAAGIVALTRMRDRLGEDHENARMLAEGMAAVPGLEVDLDRVETNIFFVDTPGLAAADLVEILEERGVRTLATGERRCRFVTHADVDSEDVDRALAVIREIVPGRAR